MSLPGPLSTIRIESEMLGLGYFLLLGGVRVGIRYPALC